MVIYVGINGFGRIGRIIFRKCFENNDLQVAAINDPAVDIDYICYLIKFDSTHGRFKNTLIFADNEITIDDTKIYVFHEKLPSSIPWQAAGVQYVVEASGMFTNLERALGHLASESVKRVIVTAPSVDIPMVILGVNHDKISTEQKVISCASSTLYCLAPLVKVLEDNYGIAEGFITSIHAMTPSLKPLDGLCLRGKHWRDHRSIHQNIIPAATGACKAVGKIIPQVKDKMTGLAFRVPVVNVSVLDVTVRLNKNTTLEDIIKRIKEESQSTMKNVINTSSDEAVSSDFFGDTHSCILDENSSLQLTPNFFKLICWYENEYSYACRIVDTIIYSEKCLHLEFISKIRNELFVTNKIFPKRNTSLCDKMFIKPCYNFQNKAKVLLSTSQGNDFQPKFPNEQLKTNRAFMHSDLSEEIRKTDNFQIWNDDKKVTKPSAKENIESLYTSCVAFTALDRKASFSKNQKRLEEDKAEFTQMMYKTNNMSIELNLSKCHDDYLERAVHKESISDTKLKTTICKNSPMCGDDEFRDSEVYKSVKETINVNLKGGDQNMFHQNLNSLTENSRKGTEILDNVLDAHQVIVGDDRQENTNSQSINISIINSVSSNYIPNIHDLNSLTNIKNDQNNLISTKELDHNVKYSIEIGVIQTYEPNVQNNANSVSESDLSAVADNQKLNSKEELQNKILEGIINTLSVGMSLVETRSNLRAVNTNTTISNGDRGTLSDIYDKLDSASGTDSENSFQIKERKSQVLNIADLTTSVENLARLDKICKIIEISDELSDKLFSVLDNNKQDFERKNWSFKDLCERLKLDEFYNNVFGQTKLCDF